jgi:DNA repair protein SbcD/Mre11
MKIVHLADTHLGIRQLHYADERGRNVREQDFYHVFVQAIDKIIELRPDAVVHAGDMFHGYHPSAAAIGIALDQVKRLRDEEIPFVVISGNHSMPRVAATDHVFKLMERFGGVHVVHAGPAVVEIGDLAITAIPHCNDPDQLSEWITSARPVSGKAFNVLVAHVGLDGLGHVGAAEAGSVELSGETLEAVADFDYIALGHLHEFDFPRINAAYAGSLEPVTWADKAVRKGIIEIDLTCAPEDDGYAMQHVITGRPHVRLPAVEATNQELNLTDAIVEAAKSINVEGAIVKLPIDSVTVEAFGAVDRRRINKAFAHCLHVEFEPRYTNASSAGNSPAATLDIRDFLASYVPRGADTAAFMGRAEEFIAQASEEIGA